MAGVCFDAARTLVDLLIELGALYYTKPCFLEKQVHVPLCLIGAFTKHPQERLHHDLDCLAIELRAIFITTNLETGYVVYGVGSRAREFELGFGNILLTLPEYKAVVNHGLTPLGVSDRTPAYPRARGSPSSPPDAGR